MDAKQDPLKREARRLFNRKLVLFAHAPSAIATAIIYLSRIDLGRFPYWRRGAGTAALLLAAPSILPYIISAVHSWRTATYDRLRVSLFLLVMVLGAFGVGSVIVGAFGLSVDQSALLWILAIQAAAYFFPAEFLFDLDR